MGKNFGVSFSAKRALGVSAAKGKVSRATGIPLTKQGRQRKVGQMTGCAIAFMFFLPFPILAAYFFFKILV